MLINTHEGSEFFLYSLCSLRPLRDLCLFLFLHVTYIKRWLFHLR